MRNESVSRRGFHKLAAAAAGGLVAGAGASAVAADEKKKKPVLPDPALLMSEPNACKGLNTFKGKGKGDHSCAGQSSCAEVAKHDCKGENTCKGQGGCGGYPGQNQCKTQGSCAVPLRKDAWKLARKQFEEVMKLSGKKVGPAPK